MDAMVDLTGGLAERYEMEDIENLKKLYAHLLKSSRNGAFITCSRKVGLSLAFSMRSCCCSCGIFLFFFSLSFILFSALIRHHGSYLSNLSSLVCVLGSFLFSSIS